MAAVRPEFPSVAASLPGCRTTIAVIGLGYVGLPTALAFHRSGHRVMGIDVNDDRLLAIARGAVDLLASEREMLERAVVSDRWSLRTDLAEVGLADVVVLCVPTPVDEHRTPHLQALAGVCAEVVARARPGQTILLTSTTYLGTTRDLVGAPMEERNLLPGRDVFVAFAPERLDPGNAAFPQDMVPRVVGGLTPACSQRAVEVLSPICSTLHVAASAEVAELSKLMENTFRAVNIALAYEFADIAEDAGLDPLDVVAAAATKPYGFMPFRPGPGVGGHCIAVDPYYLLWKTRARGLATPIITRAMEAIAARPTRMVERAVNALARDGRTLAGSRVLVLGAAYKPGVADVRESPALEIMERLIAGGADVAYHDPRVASLRLAEGLRSSLVEVDAGAFDLVVVHTVQPEMALDQLLVGARRVLDLTGTATGTDRATRDVLVVPAKRRDPHPENVAGWEAVVNGSVHAEQAR